MPNNHEANFLPFIAEVGEHPAMMVMDLSYAMGDGPPKGYPMFIEITLGYRTKTEDGIPSDEDSDDERQDVDARRRNAPEAEGVGDVAERQARQEQQRSASRRAAEGAQEIHDAVVHTPHRHPWGILLPAQFQNA